MTVDLTLNDRTIESANEVLALLLGRRAAEEKGTAEKAPAPDDGIPLFEDTPAAAEDLMAETAEVPADEPAYTIEQVRAAFTKYAKNNGREAAKKLLRDSVLKFGRDIHDKYINPPRTTNFAIMFLPTEGLYAEAVRMGLIEQLQAKYRINLAGPSTMAALLNSLQMGFRTLAIQKRSSEVWDILARIKKEFKTFDDVLASTKKALDKANADLDKLVGVRTKQILRALNKVEELPGDCEQPQEILSIDPIGSYVLGAGEED